MSGREMRAFLFPSCFGLLNTTKFPTPDTCTSGNGRGMARERSIRISENALFNL